MTYTALKLAHVRPQQMPSHSDVTALAVIAALLLVALLGLYRAARSPRVDVDAAERREGVRNAAMQGAVLLLAAVMIGLPMVLGSRSRDLRAGGYAAVIAIFALQTYLNLRIWRSSDELYRRLVLETSAVSFWLMQATFFLWAAGERLHLLVRLDSWYAVSVLLMVYLASGNIASIRRGLC